MSSLSMHSFHDMWTVHWLAPEIQDDDQTTGISHPNAVIGGFEAVNTGLWILIRIYRHEAASCTHAITRDSSWFLYHANQL